MCSDRVGEFQSEFGCITCLSPQGIFFANLVGSCERNLCFLQRQSAMIDFHFAFLLYLVNN